MSLRSLIKSIFQKFYFFKMRKNFKNFVKSRNCSFHTDAYSVISTFKDQVFEIRFLKTYQGIFINDIYISLKNPYINSVNSEIGEKQKHVLVFFSVLYQYSDNNKIYVKDFSISKNILDNVWDRLSQGLYEKKIQ